MTRRPNNRRPCNIHISTTRCRSNTHNCLQYYNSNSRYHFTATTPPIDDTDTTETVVKTILTPILSDKLSAPFNYISNLHKLIKMDHNGLRADQIRLLLVFLRPNLLSLARLHVTSHQARHNRNRPRYLSRINYRHATQGPYTKPFNCCLSQ